MDVESEDAILEDDETDSVGRAEGFGILDAAKKAAVRLRASKAASSPVLRLFGDRSQALAERYPETQDIISTCGNGALEEPGQAPIQACSRHLVERILLRKFPEFFILLVSYDLIAENAHLFD